MTTSGEDRAARADGGSVARESGVEVAKSYEADRFPVPAITMTIRSEREEPVRMRLADRVPEDVSMDDVGFHPEYGSEFWSVDGHTLVYERELAPDAEIETVYGLRGPEADEPARFLGEPTIEVRSGEEADREEGGGDVLDDVNEPLVRSATFEDGSEGSEGRGSDGTTTEEGSSDDTTSDTGEDAPEKGRAADDTAEERKLEAGNDADDRGRAVDGTATDAAGAKKADDERSEETETTKEEPMDGERRPDIERVEEETTTESDAASDAATGTMGDDASGGSDGDDIDGGEENVDAEAGLAAALARELRAGRIDPEDRETLREVLGPRDSVSVRIDRLGAQVEELGAYTDALESFIDENGAARQLVRRQSERLDVLDEDVDRVEETATTNRADVEAIEGELEATGETVSTIAGDVEAFQDAIADLDEDVERIDGQFESVEGNFEEVAERFESVESRLETLDEEVDATEGTLEDLDARLDTIDERLDAIENAHESDLEELRGELESRVAERLAETERSVESVAADVEALESWRAQLSAVVGGTEANESPNDADGGTDGDGEDATTESDSA